MDKEFMSRVSNAQNGERDHYCHMLRRQNKKEKVYPLDLSGSPFGDLD